MGSLGPAGCTTLVADALESLGEYDILYRVLELQDSMGDEELG